MKISQYKAYLYDLDGTLLNSFPDLIAAIKIAIEPLPILDESQIKNAVSSGGRAMMVKAIQNRLNPKESEQKLMKFLEIYYSNSLQYSKLYDGIEELLNHHQKHKQKWGIISNKLHEPTVKIAQQLNLKADIVIGRGLLANPKPHPEPLIYACQKLNVSPNECLFIGDHQNDIMAAKNANMASALVSWGYIEDIQDLLKYKPDYLLTHPSELMA